jgi:hypothetical protein
MNSFLKVIELAAGKKHIANRIRKNSNFSYILILLEDNSTIVVVRKRYLVNNTLRSREVIDVQLLKVNLHTAFSLIKTGKFTHKLELIA